MRNLKKILALVLALVMSLSLMATAGASSFSDVDDSNPYSTAIDVLDALKVFIGYEDGSFQPTGELTRAEAAVLVYRIATGDVEGKYVENYTYMANSKFNDLDNGYGWAKGYINYCQNAEIIKGTSATTFSPGLKVTGYQLMVMVLRTLGYDKAGEFSDPITWELESARKCEQLGMLKNIPNTGDFGNAAPRQMTAEILFRGLLQNTVKYSVMTPGGYTMDATTLGYQKFTLEEVTGVVVANEYADLHRDPDLSGHSVTAPAGVTVLDVNGEKFNINVSTKLEDLGESRTTYTVENGKANGHELTGIALADTGYNDVEETGEPVDNIKTKYIHGSVDPIRYLNFGEAVGVAQATVKFTYQAEGIYDVISAVSETAAKSTFRSKYHLDPVTVPDAQLAATASYAGSGVYAIQYIPAADDLVTNGTITGQSVRLDNGHVVSIVDRTAKPDSSNIPADEQYAWRMEVEPGATYTGNDQEVVRAIFAKASWTPTGIPQGLLVNGQVFRGTQVADDYSDHNAYEVFVDNCIKVAENHVDNNINVNQRGWWLKVVDNDGDGITDYVFQTRYTVAKVSAVNADTGALTLDTWNSTTLPVTSPASDALDPVNNKGNSITANNYTGDTIEVGDVVYYAAIDGKNQAWKCEVVEGKVETVNRNAKTVKLTGNDTVYNESAVHEHSLSVDIASGVANMSNTTNMYLYLDKYGNVAAFSQNIAGGIVLLTDGWAQTLKNGVDYAAVAWDRETQSLKQYDIYDGGSLFIDTAWASNVYDHSSINSWNRIKSFVPVNCEYPATHAAGGAGVDDVHTILAYMETTDDTARLVPVDRFADVQRENTYPIRMIDTVKKVPLSTAYDTYGDIWHSWTGTAPYAASGADDKDVEVRALVNTVYYFVYHTTWDNGNLTSNPNLNGASVYVNEVVGASAAANYMKAHGIVNGVDSKGVGGDTNYIEDVYTAATLAYGQNTTPGVTTRPYYTANVVVVELGNGYYPSDTIQEQVFIYDFPEVTNDNGNYLNAWESVKAIRADGTNDEDLKIDTQSIRAYVEATTGSAFRPGLYYLERSYRTNNDDIWFIKPMSHANIRNAGVYSTGIIDASYNPIYAGGLPGDNFWVTNWYCDSTEFGGWHSETTAAAPHGRDHVHAVDPMETDTLTNKETSKYYTLSYSGNGYKQVSSLSDVGSFNAMYQGTQTPGGRWNQVLVRHDGAGNVVYAVSFAANTSATSEQFAQQVWRTVLKSEKTGVRTTFGTFYGYTFGIDAKGNAEVQKDANPGDTDLTNEAMNLTYAEARKSNTGLKFADNINSATTSSIPLMAPTVGIKPAVRATVVYNGKTYTYDLSVDAAGTYHDLVDSAHIDVTGDTFDVKGTIMTIEQYIETVEAEQRAIKNERQTYSWKFFNDKGEITDIAHTNMQDDEIRYGFVVVTSEAGVSSIYTYGAKPAADDYKLVVTEDEAGVLLTSNGSNFKVTPVSGTYVISVTAPEGVTPVIVVNGSVYKMTKGSTQTMSAKVTTLVTWTVTLTADEVGTDYVIYVRAERGGDNVKDPSTTPSTPATDAEREAATKKVEAAETTLKGIDTKTVPADKKTEFEAAAKAAEDAIKAAQALIADKTATKAKIDAAVKAAEDAVKKAEAIAKGEETTYAVTFTADGTGYTVAVKDGETALATSDKVAAGTELAVTVTAKEGYDIKSVTIGGKVQALAADGKYTYTTTAAETKIEVTAEAKTPSEITLPDATKDTEAGTATIPWYNADTTVTKMPAADIVAALKDVGIDADAQAVSGASSPFTVIDKNYKSWTVTVNRYWKVFVDETEVGYVAAANGGKVTNDILTGTYLEKDTVASSASPDGSLTKPLVAAAKAITITGAVGKDVVLVPAVETEGLGSNVNLNVSSAKAGAFDTPTTLSADGYVQLGATAQVDAGSKGSLTQYNWYELSVKGVTPVTKFASTTSAIADLKTAAFTVSTNNLETTGANEGKMVVKLDTGKKVYFGDEYKGVLEATDTIKTTSDDKDKIWVPVSLTAAHVSASDDTLIAKTTRTLGADDTVDYSIAFGTNSLDTDSGTNNGIVVFVPAFKLTAADNLVTYEYELAIDEVADIDLTAGSAVDFDGSPESASSGVYLAQDATVSIDSGAVDKWISVKVGAADAELKGTLDGTHNAEYELTATEKATTHTSGVVVGTVTKITGLAFLTAAGIKTKAGSATTSSELQSATLPTGVKASSATIIYYETADTNKAAKTTIVQGTAYTIEIKVEADTGYAFDTTALATSVVTVAGEASGAATITVTSVSAPDDDGFVTITATFTGAAA